MEKENTEPIFPEESALIIGSILENFGIIGSDEEEIEKIRNILKDSSIKIEEKMKKIDNLPQSKTARLVKEYGEGKIASDKIVSELKSELNIDQEKAKKIAQELKIKLLDLIKPIKQIGIVKTVEKESIKTNEEDRIIPEKTPSPQKKQKTPRSIKKDIYREKIE